MLNLNKQSGAALITSIVILLLLAVLGVAALGSAIMSEKMSQNAQLTMSVYSGSVSGVDGLSTEIQQRDEDTAQLQTAINNLTSFSCVTSNGLLTANCGAAADTLNAAMNLKTLVSMAKVNVAMGDLTASSERAGSCGVISKPAECVGLLIRSTSWIESFDGVDNGAASGDEPRVVIETLGYYQNNAAGSAVKSLGL